MAHGPDINIAIDAVPGRVFPKQAHLVSIMMMIVGVIGAAYGFTSAEGGLPWTWGAILVAIVYTMGIAQGGLIFCVILTGAWARWGRPVKRVGEALGYFLPVVYLALLLFLVLGLQIYPWHPETITPAVVDAMGQPQMVALEPHSLEAISSKPWWLSKGFFIGRQVFGFGLLITLSLKYAHVSLRSDLVLASARLGDRAPAWWARITGGATDASAAQRESMATQSKMFPFIVICYAFVFSLLAFDLLMSLAPWWFSNMFGAWIFMSSLWLGMATIGFVSMLSRDWLSLGEFVTPKVTHDLGMLLLAACMFWAYTTFAQILPIWYTDMPEETDYLLVRMYLPQWSWMAQLVAVMCFLGPFTILLSRGIKKMRWPFAAICLLIMTGIFMERSLVVMPSVYFGDEFPIMDFLVVNVGILIGFLGMMVQVVGRSLAAIPAVVISDPYLSEHPWDAHVHAAKDAEK